jgi:hypothetical protein
MKQIETNKPTNTKILKPCRTRSRKICSKINQSAGNFASFRDLGNAVLQENASKPNKIQRLKWRQAD